MSGKPGRNDPCPCGSGRKFKHCCGSSAAAPVESPESLAWRRIRRLLEENNEQLHRFTMNAYGPQALPEAWDEFNCVAPEKTEFDFESPHFGIFMSWFQNFWSPDLESEVPDKALRDVEPVDAYLARRGARLDPLMREYLESCLEAPLSFHEVVAVEPGRGFILRDLVTGLEQPVSERAASGEARPGDILFAQVVRAGGLALLECCSAFFFPPIARIEIDGACRRLVRRRKRATFPLREYDLEMLEIYHVMAKRTLNPALPAMHNTDGDPISMRRVVFDIESAERAFEALRHLEPADEGELAQTQRRDGDGRLVEGQLHWVEPSKTGRGGMSNTILGTLTISGSRLIAEVNSEARERRLREIVEVALGAAARHRATEIQSIEKMLDEARSKGPTTPSAQQMEDERLMEVPEVKALMAEHMSRHYEGWVEERLPALGNRTPLQAVRTPEGRKAVEALVRQIERDGERMRPPLDPGITKRLRDRLALKPRD